MVDHETLHVMREQAHPLLGLGDVDVLLRLVGNSRIVLWGEATHGTHEFYKLRAELSRRLIVDKGFDAVVVEADWPAALRASRYAQGADDDHSAESALRGFARFPRWMWRNAEAYYRTMFDGRTDSWNLRDRHMADTLDALDRHLSQQRGRPARLVVWAHNSHIGDARATDAAERGQWNLGQLVRESQKHPLESFLLGFTTHTGIVAAATDWDMPVEFKPIVPSRPASIERLLHDSGCDRFVLPLREADASLRTALSPERLQRAIGVVYRPDTERWSHYFGASLARQFDAVVHIDTTSALAPLDHEEPVRHEAEPETFPSGI